MDFTAKAAEYAKNPAYSLLRWGRVGGALPAYPAGGTTYPYFLALHASAAINPPLLT